MPQVYFDWQVTRITTDTNTQIFSGAGIIHAILIEGLGTAPATATVKDSATTKVVIDTSTAGQLNQLIVLDIAIATQGLITTAAGATKATIAVFWSSGSSPRNY